MITEGRLRAVIDQAEGFIDFLQATDEGDDANGRGGSGDIAGATVASVGDPLGDWNESIRALCTDVSVLMPQQTVQCCSCCFLGGVKFNADGALLCSFNLSVCCTGD